MNEVKLIGTIVMNKYEDLVKVVECKNGNKYSRFKLACPNDNGGFAFVDCEAWGSLSDRVSGKKKGDRIKLVGCLKTPKSYEKDGKKVYPSNVVLVTNLAVVDNGTNAPKENELPF